MTETTETDPIEKAKAHITGLPGFSEYCDYLYSRQGHDLPPAGDFLCAISKLVTSLTKEREELKVKVDELNQDVRFKCGQVAEHIQVRLKLVNENKRLKSQLSNRDKEIKELEEKLNNEWKPASEAVEGREYDVAGGEYILADDHTCYPSWSGMGSRVRVATYKGIDYDGEPDFEGEYGECYNSEYHYKPKWIRERPTPPTPQEEYHLSKTEQDICRNSLRNSVEVKNDAAQEGGKE